ncbi:hypothetical protein LUZ63_022832 [Rhynchospora breviuscula]|uniref:4'-phosphopantetheinyl transferase domain-containing protein n=1 Tax=Rhynchospora breviuscula TaxID=2022672 RepID=A0A9Q0BXI9_9POAL|nr:hypothetical protein LUZ63_022832 [Rhynchospora breviuscula]
MCNVPAFARRVQRARNDFIGRFWTPVEIDQSGGRMMSLAARWGAKEATMKALEAGIGRVDPVDIEVELKNGAPHLNLRGSARDIAEKLGLMTWSVSLTHDGLYAMAFVVAVGGEDGQGQPA